MFFSDIKDFSTTTERLQPEEITALLNEYFAEMCRIADAHGATVDEFVGDAIIAFFGDPETRGVVEDARACVRMAIAMQHRLDELAVSWRERGIEHPFQARMGINTGYCNVGNFGSDERMDYTIIGAEANLSARLESIAAPGGIVVSYETYVHVSDLFEARRLEPMRFKGIAREIVAYEICIPQSEEMKAETLEECIDGLSLRLNSRELDGTARSQARALLRRALRSLEQA